MPDVIAGVRGHLERLKRSAAAAADASAALQHRDERIAQLEEAIAAEHARREEFERRIKALEFRLEVQEKGYTTQLAEARRLTDEADRRVAERQAALDALTQEHEQTLRTLSDVRARLERLKYGQAKRTWRPTTDGRAAPPGADDNTINALLSAAGPADDGAARAPRRQTGDAPAAPTDDLIDPGLVFAAEDTDDA